MLACIRPPLPHGPYVVDPEEVGAGEVRHRVGVPLFGREKKEIGGTFDALSNPLALEVLGAEVVLCIQRVPARGAPEHPLKPCDLDLF